MKTHHHGQHGHEAGAGSPDRAQGAAYTCPMHPGVTSDEPGTCPKCGLDLTPVEQQVRHSGAHGGMAMGERGVTRMEHDPERMGEMTPEHRQMMEDEHHGKTAWVPVTVSLLGFWLVASPITFGYATTVGGGGARITAERNLAPIAERAAQMAWSDVASGIALVVLGALWLSRSRIWAPWLACGVGMWLLFAPLVFWAPAPAMYANDSVVGALVIALTILIPGMPGMMRIMQMGPEVPPGWSYNPSSWLQRAPVIALGWVGFFLGRYLAAYQLGYVDHVWDPFFGAGTDAVLDSDVSKWWPISDAGLGATAYTLEALMGFMGGASRWRTMPWMVLLFGILVVPLGLVSITLVIMQPVAVGTWCTICLLTALAMLVMIPLTLDEVWAMGQFVVRKVREGESFWRVFWLGGTVAGGGKDERSPALTAPLAQAWPAMTWGVTVPWSLLVQFVLGTWLMFAPAVFGTMGSPAGGSDALAGALVAVVAVVAMAEVARAARFLNVLAGLWIAAAPWLLAGATSPAIWHDLAAGLAIAALSLPLGSVRECYAAWDRYVAWPARREAAAGGA